MVDVIPILLAIIVPLRGVGVRLELPHVGAPVITIVEVGLNKLVDLAQSLLRAELQVGVQMVVRFVRHVLLVQRI